MELIVSNAGFKIECAGCMAKTKIGDIKKIGKKYYCPNCQGYIMKKLKGEIDLKSETNEDGN